MSGEVCVIEGVGDHGPGVHNGSCQDGDLFFKRMAELQRNLDSFRGARLESEEAVAPIRADVSDSFARSPMSETRLCRKGDCCAFLPTNRFVISAGTITPRSADPCNGSKVDSRDVLRPLAEFRRSSDALTLHAEFGGSSVSTTAGPSSCISNRRSPNSAVDDATSFRRNDERNIADVLSAPSAQCGRGKPRGRLAGEIAAAASRAALEVGLRSVRDQHCSSHEVMDGKHQKDPWPLARVSSERRAAKVSVAQKRTEVLDLYRDATQYRNSSALHSRRSFLQEQGERRRRPAQIPQGLQKSDRKRASSCSMNPGISAGGLPSLPPVATEENVFRRGTLWLWARHATALDENVADLLGK